MKILTVVPLQKTNFKEELTYFSALDIELGAIVSITLKNKKMLGLVIASINANDIKSEVKKMDFKIKKIIDTKKISIFDKDYIKAILKIAEYSINNKSQIASYLIPNVLKENYDQISEKINGSNKIQIKSTLPAEKLLFQQTISDRLDYYKILIRESFASKKSVFMVLPTEHDIKYFEENLKKGIESFVFSLYGGLNPKKNLEKVIKITSENHPVLIIGTTPYLAITRNDIDTIILEKENSSGYRTLSKPYFDLRTFVETYAFLKNIKLILADNLLRFETIGRKDLENINEAKPLYFRIENKIEIKERKKEDGQFNIFNKTSIELIKNNLNSNGKIFIFSLRKGLATYTVCRNCNEEIVCEECKMPLVLYKSQKSNKRMFVCNHCKNQKNTEITCPNCNSWDLAPLGIGTETIIEELLKYFPKEDILRLDKESAKNNTQAEKIIKEFETKKSAILVGTEISLSYIKEKVDLAIIASFDSLFTIPNYKITEKIVQIILNTLNKTKEHLIIETKNTNNEIILESQSLNLLSLIRNELYLRKELGYPPYQRFIKISFIGEKEKIIKTKILFEDLFKEYNPIIFSGFIKGQKNKYVLNTLIKLDLKDWPYPFLNKHTLNNGDLKNKLTSLPNDFNIQIDPEDLL